MTDDLARPSEAAPTGAPTPAGEPAPIWQPSTTSDAAPVWSPSTASAPDVTPDVPSPVPTVPVLPQAPRRSRTRWIAAGLVAILVIAVAATGLVAMSGGSTSSTVSAWSPSDAIFYAEVRADLPGDQHQNLAAFLAHFPGFADQSALDAKLSEALDKLVKAASQDKHDWSTEIKPWFGGQIGISVSALPTPPTASDASGVRMLEVTTQKDPVKAMAWVASLGLGTSTSETYKAATLSVYPAQNGLTVAVTVVGPVLLVGDITSVKAAIDRNGADGLTTNPSFKDAMAGLSGDQITRSYVDVPSLVKYISSAEPSLTQTPGFDKVLGDLGKAAEGMGGRVESDALIGKVSATASATSSAGTNKPEVIAGKLPGSTIALFEAHDVGAGVKASLDELKKIPAYEPAITQLESATQSLGGVDFLTGWVGDLGVVVTSDGTTPSGGLVIIPTDTAKATQAFTSLKTLLTLAGVSSNIKMTDEAYGDGTITTIDFGDVSTLAGAASGGMSLSPTLPISGHAEVSFTIQRGVVVIGVGPAFVKSIIDVKAGASLADQARYTSAMNRIGSSNIASGYIDIPAIRKLAEPLAANLPPGGPNYATDVKPYLEPFDVMAFSSTNSGNSAAIAFILTVIKP